MSVIKTNWGFERKNTIDDDIEDFFIVIGNNETKLRMTFYENAFLTPATLRQSHLLNS